MYSVKVCLKEYAKIKVIFHIKTVVGIENNEDRIKGENMLNHTRNIYESVNFVIQII